MQVERLDGPKPTRICPSRAQPHGPFPAAPRPPGTTPHPKGIPVKLFSRTTPTPFVAFGTARLGAAAGVMVTASHNTKEYNGYKARALLRPARPLRCCAAACDTQPSCSRWMPRSASWLISLARPVSTTKLTGRGGGTGHDQI